MSEIWNVLAALATQGFTSHAKQHHSTRVQPLLPELYPIYFEHYILSDSPLSQNSDASVKKLRSQHSDAMDEKSYLSESKWMALL